MPLLTQYTNSTQLQTYTHSSTPSTSDLIAASIFPSPSESQTKDPVDAIVQEMNARAQSFPVGLGHAITTIREKGFLGALRHWFSSDNASKEKAEEFGFCAPQGECLLLSMDSTRIEKLDVIREMPRELVNILGGEEAILKFPILELGDSRGWTDYIDFINKSHMGLNPVMWGRDAAGRIFVNFNREDSVITYFRRYSPLDGIPDNWVYGGGRGEAGPDGINIQQLAKEAGLQPSILSYSENTLIELYDNAKRAGKYVEFSVYVNTHLDKIDPAIPRNILLSMMYGAKGETAEFQKIQVADFLLRKFYDKMPDRAKTTLLHFAITAGNEQMYQYIERFHLVFQERNPDTPSHYADKTVALMNDNPYFTLRFAGNCEAEASHDVFQETMNPLKKEKFSIPLVEADDEAFVEHIKGCYERSDEGLGDLADCFTAARAYHFRPRRVAHS